MKKVFACIFILLVSFTTQPRLGAQPAATTPIAPPAGSHNAVAEIQKHLMGQYLRIKKALLAKTITIAQTKALRAQVELASQKQEDDFLKNQAHTLTPDQEKGIYRLLNNSARAIDQAAGRSTDPS
jgi:hypothetical protein